MTSAADAPSWAGAAVLASLWLVPFVLLMLTSFVKVSVVLAILRSAIGAADVPPTLVLTGVALVLTGYIMAPTAQAVAADVEGGLSERQDAASMFRAVRRGVEPIREFLFRHSSAADRKLFAELSTQIARDEKGVLGEKDLAVLAPAFVIGELADAFRIGFLVFVPFLVVDLVIANILLALGMTSLPATAVSLPFKLLLFVMVDGWRLLVRGLILTYR